jgi:hypothetical protein
VYANGTFICGQAGGGLPTVLSIDNTADRDINLSGQDLEKVDKLNPDGRDMETGGDVISGGGSYTSDTEVCIGDQCRPSKTAWNYDTDGDGDLETAEYYGQGTASDPYEIRSLTALQAIEKNSTTRSNSYFLDSDIDASPTSSWNSGKGFDPINSYSGTFSGNDHTITNLTINRPTETEVGLLSKINNGGLVENIHIKNASIYGEAETGAIAGDNSGTVSSCTATEIYTNTSSGRSSLLVGFNDGDGTIEKCGSSGEIKDLSGSEIGGVAGYNNGGTIRDVYSRVNITHDQNFQVAGVTGVNTPGGTIENAYAVTNIDGNQNFEVEGLIGDERGGTVNNLYLDVDASNKGTGVGTELSTSEMTGDSAADNMNGFDFQNVWRTVNGEYPKLR